MTTFGNQHKIIVLRHEATLLLYLRHLHVDSHRTFSAEFCKQQRRTELLTRQKD